MSKCNKMAIKNTTLGTTEWEKLFSWNCARD